MNAGIIVLIMMYTMSFNKGATVEKITRVETMQFKTYEDCKKVEESFIPYKSHTTKFDGAACTIISDHRVSDAPAN